MPRKNSTDEYRAIDADDLPALMSAVLKHPDLPHYLWDSLTDALLEVGSDQQILESPDYIRAVVNVTKQRKR